MSKPNRRQILFPRHEWLIYYSDGTALIGISDYAQEMLTDIVFVDLPENRKKSCPACHVAVVES